jgi:hypothetical protein
LIRPQKYSEQELKAMSDIDQPDAVPAEGLSAPVEALAFLNPPVADIGEHKRVSDGSSDSDEDWSCADCQVDWPCDFASGHHAGHERARAELADKLGDEGERIRKEDWPLKVDLGYVNGWEAAAIWLEQERADPAPKADGAEEDAAFAAKPNDCRACPDGCGSCLKDQDCECYEHQNWSYGSPAPKAEKD